MIRAAVTLVLATVALAACSSAPAATRVARHRAPVPHIVATSPRARPVTRVQSGPPARGSASSEKRPTPKPNPCAHNTGHQLVRVSLRRQHLWMCAHRKVAYSSAVTSGMAGEYTATPTGHYAIQGLNRNSVLTLADGQHYDVKYWIPFDAPLFGFHDSPWQKFPYGSAKYRTDGSHGCVHLPLKTIAFLYRWATIGTPVVIR